MKIKNHIVRKFDDKYIVWLEEYNQWIQLEEPAYLVFEELRSGRSDVGNPDSYREGRGDDGFERGVSRIMEKYGLEKKAAVKFVNEILLVFESLEKPVEEVKKDLLPVAEPEVEWISHIYKANGITIKFEFATELLEYYNHHIFAHLEVEDDGEVSRIFRVFDRDGIHILRQMKPLEKEWEAEEHPGLKRRILIEFGNLIHSKDITEWMSLVHGTVITNRKNSLILSSASGSGKTTLAALLQKEGYELACDDYVPIDGETAQAYPFPAAFSIKEGSFEMLSEFYPELKIVPEKKFRLTNKSIRYFPPAHMEEFNYNAFPVTHLVFVTYNSDIDFKLEPLSTPEALLLFTKEAWTSGNAEYAENFIDWFGGLKCYRLEYCDNERVVMEMGRLLEDG